MRECDVFIPYMSRHTYQISVLINMDAHVPTTSRFRLKFAGQTFLFGYLPTIQFIHISTQTALLTGTVP